MFSVNHSLLAFCHSKLLRNRFEEAAIHLSFGLGCSCDRRVNVVITLRVIVQHKPSHFV